MPDSLSGPTRTRFGYVMGRLHTCEACEGNMVPVLEQSTSVWLIVCWKPKLSRPGLLGVKRVGLWDLLGGAGTGKSGVLAPLQDHTTLSILNSDPDLLGASWGPAGARRLGASGSPEGEASRYLLRIRCQSGL